MIIKPSIILCFSLLSPNDNIYMPYQPYTTSTLMTNNSMYNVNELIEKIFIKEEKR